MCHPGIWTVYLVPFYARNRIYMEIYDRSCVSQGFMGCSACAEGMPERFLLRSYALPFSHEKQIHLSAASAMFLLVRV